MFVKKKKYICIMVFVKSLSSTTCFYLLLMTVNVFLATKSSYYMDVTGVMALYYIILKTEN